MGAEPVPRDVVDEHDPCGSVIRAAGEDVVLASLQCLECVDFPLDPSRVVGVIEAQLKLPLAGMRECDFLDADRRPAPQLPVDAEFITNEFDGIPFTGSQREACFGTLGHVATLQ